METITFETLPKAVSLIFDRLGLIEQALTKERQTEPDRLFTIEQAANFLNLSVATLYTKVHNCEIPSCKQGKRLYFLQSDLGAWIKQGRRKTSREIELEAANHIKKGGNNAK